MTSLPANSLTTGALVIYRGRPARIAQLAEKLTLELPGGESAQVRPKDIMLLHPGPLRSLSDLRAAAGGEVQLAWELLAGGQTTLAELAELIYGAFSPATAWAAWQLVADGLYFRQHGRESAPLQIAAATADEVQRKLDIRRAEAAEKANWESFVAHVRGWRAVPAAADFAALPASEIRLLKEIEALALGRQAHSRVVRELGGEETPEAAHALLLDIGFWSPAHVPYAQRLALPLTAPTLPLPPLPDEPRRDLTHLAAFAIDDASTTLPDDALSLDADGRVWVHIADVAALVQPGDPADAEACGRAATLFLPEIQIPMLPASVAAQLGLGLQEISPALSFGIVIGDDGQIVELEITPSWVRVTRLTYTAAEALITQEPLATLERLCDRHWARRHAQGAVEIELPEVRVAVHEGEVSIEPLTALRGRRLVGNAMVLVGDAVARFAQERGIPVPFATQEIMDEATPELRRAQTWSQMFTLRRMMRRSQYRVTPGGHAGLGLPAYVQATSPLRRYLDLATHQQLRAHLRGASLLSPADLLARIGAVEAVGGSLREAESKANTHWTLVYLQQNPNWQGEGVLVEKRGAQGVFVIGSLGLETTLALPGDASSQLLDAPVMLQARQIDLPRLDVRFRIVRA